MDQKKFLVKRKDLIWDFLKQLFCQWSWIQTLPVHKAGAKQTILVNIIPKGLLEHLDEYDDFTKGRLEAISTEVENTCMYCTIPLQNRNYLIQSIKCTVQQ